jgi:hypothetical protein
LFDDQHQRFDGVLPVLELLFCFRELLDVPGRVLEGDELPAIRQLNRNVEATLPRHN